ncbi:MAG: hypothetical protein HY231_04370 [Acidobacteria bacterium]|nr:hypothetical protein [Acidobacteriota bacterium]
MENPESAQQSSQAAVETARRIAVGEPSESKIFLVTMMDTQASRLVYWRLPQAVGDKALGYCFGGFSIYAASQSNEEDSKKF